MAWEAQASRGGRMRRHRLGPADGFARRANHRQFRPRDALSACASAPAVAASPSPRFDESTAGGMRRPAPTRRATLGTPAYRWRIGIAFAIVLAAGGGAVLWAR